MNRHFCSIEKRVLLFFGLSNCQPKTATYHNRPHRILPRDTEQHRNRLRQQSANESLGKHKLALKVPSYPSSSCEERVEGEDVCSPTIPYTQTVGLQVVETSVQRETL